MKLLLHACCGPCSLEPVRLLQDAGHDLTIAYMNSNIAPEEEYERRRDTLAMWATSRGIPLIEGAYDPSAWEQGPGRAGDDHTPREARCRACYRLRFEEAAQTAAKRGFDAIGTTLSVSPHQYTDVIADELARAARHAGVGALFEDYRPHYDEATRRSRELGMYRQNYCGCRFSDAEAAAERAALKQERTAAREAKRAADAHQRTLAEEAQAAKRAERQAHADRQARKHAVLKELRAQKKDL